MNQYQGLIERVRAATGPDLDLDEAIIKRLGFHSWAGRMSYHDAPKWIDFGQSTLTASIDACVALIERTLPDWWWLREDGFSIRLVGPDNGEYNPSSDGKHELVPHAMLLALLLALQGEKT